jgi:hypothetical protein
MPSALRSRLTAANLIVLLVDVLLLVIGLTRDEGLSRLLLLHPLYNTPRLRLHLPP